MPIHRTVMMRIASTLVLTALWVFQASFAQIQPQPVAQDTPKTQGPQKTDIHIQSTDLLHFAKFGPDSVKIRKLIGNVELRQDSTFIYCDSALQFIDTSLIIARGNVVITMEGNRTIWADELDYSGDTKILVLNKHVIMKDSAVTLFTDKLTYYKNEGYGEYLTGGKLVSKENVLTSKKGSYFPDSKMAYFKDDVLLDNPDYQLTTDTLGYNTDTRIAFFLSPTWVKDSLNTMYTEDGYYDTENDFAYLHTRCQIGDEKYTLFADTILYDQQADLGKALGNVIAEQKDSTLTVFGRYAQFKSAGRKSYVTDSSFAVQISKEDTLFLFSDTLHTFTDTTTDKRFFQAHYNTKIYMNELQGVCDSLSYWYDDSLLFMYKYPYLWSDESQLSGDTICMGMKDGGIDTLYIPSSPMIATKEDTVGFNQIKGTELHAKFKDKDIQKMYIYGNSESIYFTKDDREAYIGMNIAKCSNMFIDFKNNKPSRILFDIQPEGTFYPMSMIPKDKSTLEGFRWMIDARPTKPTWAAKRIKHRYGPVDSMAMALDSVLMRIDAVGTLLDTVLMNAFEVPNVDTAITEIDTNDVVIIDTMDVETVDTAGRLPEVTPTNRVEIAKGNMYDFTGAGNRMAMNATKVKVPKEKRQNKPPKADKPKGLTAKVKALFAEKPDKPKQEKPKPDPKQKEQERMKRLATKVGKKADKEASARLGKVDRAYFKSINKVNPAGIYFAIPRIKSHPISPTVTF